MSEYKKHDNELYDNKTDEFAKSAQDKAAQSAYDGSYIANDGVDKVNSARDALLKNKKNKYRGNHIDDSGLRSNKRKNSNNSNNPEKKNNLKEKKRNSPKNSRNNNSDNNTLKNSNKSPVKKDIDKNANPFNKSKIVRDQNKRTAQKAGKKGAKKGVEKGAEAVKKGTESVAKTAAEGAKHTFTAIVSSMGPAGIAVIIGIILVICTIFIAIIVIIASQNASVAAAAQANKESSIELTEEGKKILSVFKSYVLTSNDSDSNGKYDTYNEILDNGYAPALCGMWKEITMEKYITNRSKKWKVRDIVKGSYGKGYEDSGKPPSFTESATVKDKIDKKTKKYSDSFNAMYDYFCGQFYLKKKAGTYIDKTFTPNYYLSESTYIVGKDFNYINSSKSKKDENNIANSEYHYSYCNNVIKACLGAFVDKKTDNVFESGESFLDEYKKIQKEKGKNIADKTDEELIEQSRNYQIRQAIKNLEGKNGLLEKCKTKVTVKRKTTSKKVYETVNNSSDDSDETTETRETKQATEKEKPKRTYKTITVTKETFINQHLSDWIYETKDKNIKWLYNKKTHKFDKEIKKNIIDFTDELTAVKEDGSYNGGSDASEVCELANSQLGKMGKDYCLGQTKCWSGGMEEWCAIFQGWLLEQVGLSPVKDIGWSASCSSWISQASGKGLYRASGNYKPSPGDIIFFSWGHVGLVYDVKGEKLITIEGNTDSYNRYTSKVGKHTNYTTGSSSVRGYIDMSKFYSDNSQTGGLAKGTGLKPRYTDPHYKGGKYKLTASQRRKMLYLIHNENGGSWAGAVLTAQTIRDQLKRDKSETPDTIRHGGRNFEALDSYMPGRGHPGKYAKRALSLVFDKGGYAVKHRILYFKAVSVCNSRGTGGWHDTQLFICSIGNGNTLEKFYDSADGYKG